MTQCPFVGIQAHRMQTFKQLSAIYILNFSIFYNIHAHITRICFNFIKLKIAHKHDQECTGKWIYKYISTFDNRMETPKQPYILAMINEVVTVVRWIRNIFFDIRGHAIAMCNDNVKFILFYDIKMHHNLTVKTTVNMLHIA